MNIESHEDDVERYLRPRLLASFLAQQPQEDREPAPPVDEVPTTEVTASEDDIDASSAEVPSDLASSDQAEDVQDSVLSEAGAEPEQELAQEPSEPTVSTRSVESESDPVAAAQQLRPTKESLKNARAKRTTDLNGLNDALKRDTASFIKDKLDKPVPKAPREAPAARDPEAAKNAINKLKERNDKVRAAREAKKEQIAKYVPRPVSPVVMRQFEAYGNPSSQKGIVMHPYIQTSDMRYKKPRT